MADLPPDRLKLFSPPFTATGVDLFGPFHLKHGRNKIIKSWGAVFTCATVRAIHLEIVQDLSTEAFLHALRRFAARHGWPTTNISDNGTSFIGAESELIKLMKEGRKEIEDFAVTHKIKWRFNTPLSPHQGGMFESMVKQTKTALKVIVGQL
jgi:transposase InsO family protein